MNYQDIIRTLYAFEGNQGFDEDTLTLAETRIGHALPPVLKEYYHTLGTHERLNAGFNRLLTPAQLGFSDNWYLVFYIESQAVAVWGIKKEDLLLDNPPVYGSYDHGATWIIEAETTEKFLLNMAYMNAALGALPYSAATTQITEQAVKQIRERWAEQKNLVYQYLRFFTNDYRYIIAMTVNEEEQATALYVGAGDETRFREMMDALDVAWDYRSDLDEQEP